MKKLIVCKILVACLLFNGCATFPNPVVDSIISIGVGEFLQRGISNTSTRTQVANYLDVAAEALRAVAAPITPAELSALIAEYIPANVQSQYPEIMLGVNAIIIPEYEIAYQKYADNFSKLLPILNEIGNDINAGASPYATH